MRTPPPDDDDPVIHDQTPTSMHITMPTGLLAQIERWRAGLLVVPSRSAALVELLRRGLATVLRGSKE